MKIICIGRNYSEHARELKNEIPDKPVIFMKPDTALLPQKQPFFVPSFSNDVHHEAEIVIRINRVGKKIEQRFAHKYYEELTLGIDFTARDLQTELKQKGLPWETAKGFDGSAPLGEFISKTQFPSVQEIEFSLSKNGETVQVGNTSQMIFSIDYIIHYVSQFFTLKIGDLIFTGTPAGVGKVNIGDHLEGFIGAQKVLDCKVK